MSLDSLRDAISKSVKGTHVAILSDSEIAKQTINLPTPAYDLNRILSGSLFKGLPARSVSLLVGPETSGKSSLACLILAEAQRNGYTPVIIDSEAAWTDEFVSRWGMDPNNMLYIYNMWVDEIMVILGQILDSEDEKMALVLDSIGALETRKLMDDALGGDVKADQGQLQRKIKRMLKMLQDISVKKNSLVLLTGHYYGKPNAYGAAEDIGGGNYVKLAPQVIVSLKKSKLFDSNDKKKVIGNTLKAITLKNRFYPAFEEAVVEIDYRKGINAYAGILDLAMKAGLAEQGGAWYTINGEKYQGSISAEEGLRNDKEILKKLDEWLSNTGYSTVNKNIMEAKKIIDDEDVDVDIETKGMKVSKGPTKKK